MSIPKLTIYSSRHRNYVKCPNLDCDFWGYRYNKINNKKIDALGEECPYCRMRKRLEERKC